MRNLPASVPGCLAWMLALAIQAVGTGPLAAQTALPSKQTPSAAPERARVTALLEKAHRDQYDAPKACLEAATEALALARQHDLRGLQSKALSYLGIAHRNMNEYQEALRCFQEALALSERENDTEQIAFGNNNIGGIRRLMGEPTQAMAHFLKAQLGFEGLGNLVGQALVHENFAMVQRDQKLHTLALESIHRALALRQQLKDSSGVGKDLLLMSEIQAREGRREEAIQGYTEALALFRGMNKQFQVAVALSGLGRVEFDSGNPAGALRFLKEALEINLRLENRDQILRIRTYLGRIQARLGNLREAKAELDRAQELTRVVGTLAREVEVIQAWAEYQEVKGDFREALRLRKEAETLIGRLINEESAQAVSILQIRHQADQQRQENELLRRDNELARSIAVRQRWAVLAALMGLGFTTILALLFFRGRREEQAARLMLAAKNQEIEAREQSLSEAYAELQELGRFKEAMSGMIAHDLKNSLGLILDLPADLATDHQLGRARQAALQMMTLVMNLLDVQKFEEARMKLALGPRNLRDLCQGALGMVESMAVAKGVQIQDDIPRTLGCHCDGELVGRVFVNLLTNAIKFTSAGGSVSLSAEPTGDGFVAVTVRDTGQGIAPGVLPFIFEKFTQAEDRMWGGIRSTGLGLAFCRMALEAHGCSISAESYPGEGSCFRFTLPAEVPVLAGASLSAPGSGAGHLDLTPTEWELLQPVLQELQGVELFEISKLRAATRPLFQGGHPGLRRWRQALLDAAASGDAVAYRRLLQLQPAEET